MQWRGVSFVLPSSLSQKLFDLLLEPGDNMRRDLIRLVLTNLFRFSGKRPGWFYLNVGHTGLDRPGHATWIRHMGVRPIYFVHDLIPLTHPEYCRPGEPEKHLLRMQSMLDHGAGVIANSADTINELTVFAKARRGVAMPQAMVAPLGVTGKGTQSTAQSRDSAIPERPYFVMLGTIEGRKNHLLILNVWAELARRLGPACPQLVVIGQRGWECEQVVDMLERCKAIHGHVIELPRCDDIHLRSLMAGAQALLFPSFVEGYGLPLVEALADGTPVIASDLGVFRELAADIPDYLSPVDGLGWMRAIEDYAREDSPMRAAQMARMSGWSAPTWEDHFARVDAFLEELSHRPG